MDKASMVKVVLVFEMSILRLVGVTKIALM